MLEPPLILAIAAGVGVAALKYRTEVRLWHVLFLSATSILLIAVNTLDGLNSEESLIAEWVPFGSWGFFYAGLALGLIALVRSYQYRAVVEKRWQQKHREEFEAKHGREQRTWDDVL